FNAGGVVDTGRAALHFGTAHNLKTNDQVVYDCNGNGPLGGVAALNPPNGGLTCGATYYVFKVDDFTIRLRPVGSGAFPANTTAISVVPSATISGSTFTVGSTAGLVDNGAYVYHAPAPVTTFTSSMVDILVDGNHQLVRSDSGSCPNPGTGDAICHPSP